jgi:hypothetical protein
MTKKNAEQMKSTPEHGLPNVGYDEQGKIVEINKENEHGLPNVGYDEQGKIVKINKQRNDQEILDFTRKMAKKYPGKVTRPLDMESNPRTFVSISDFNGSPKTIIEVLKRIERFISLCETLGKALCNVCNYSGRYADCEITLYDPCDEDLVDKAIKAGFEWRIRFHCDPSVIINDETDQNETDDDDDYDE